MRRILFGVAAAVFMLSGVVLPGYGKSMEDNIGFAKVWETSLDDRVTMDPVISKDGRLYGINSYVSDLSENKLMCIQEGKVAWSSQESFSTYEGSLLQTLLVDNLVIAGDYLEVDKDENKKSFLLICYTVDGKKVWDKKMKLNEYSPSYEVYKGNIWLMNEKIIHVLDAKTGNELKKIDLSKTVQNQALRVNSTFNPKIEDKLRYAEIIFVGDSMLLYDEKNYRSFKVTDELSLEQKWERELPKTSDGYPIRSNFMTWYQANEDFFLMAEDESKIVCRSTETGDINWSMDYEEIVYSTIKYNKSFMLIGDYGPFSCYSIANQSLAWTYKNEGYPAVLSDKYVYFIIDDRNGPRVELARLRAGGTITKVNETDFDWIVVNENDMYFLKRNGICKYSMCNPCACNVNVSWKENGKDTIEFEICNLDEKKLEILIENPNDKAIVECIFKTSSEMFSMSDNSIAVGPNEKKTVFLICTVGMEYPETFDGYVEINTNCNQTFKLNIKGKKASSCKEKLNKNWSLPSGNFFNFGDVLVRYEEESTGMFDSKLTGLTAFSKTTGKSIWSVASSELMPDCDRIELDDVVGNLMIIQLLSPSRNGWVAINCIDGKIAWKRDSGMPASFGQWYKTACSPKSLSTYTDLFDVATGKTIVSKLKLECNSSAKLACKIGSDYLIYVYTDSTFKTGQKKEDEPNAWLVRPDGRVYWKKNLYACLAKDNFEYESLYLVRNLEPEDDENDYIKCKIAKVDPIKLDVIWSTIVDGYPSIVMQDESKIVFSYYGGISCYNPKDGNKLWGYSDENHGMSYPVQVKGLLYTQTWNRDDKSPEKNQMYAIDPQTGKNMHEMEFDWYAHYYWDGKLLYIVDENWSLKPKKNIVHCINVDTWEILWTATGYGELAHVGEKLIFDDGQIVSWFENGKQAGSYDTSSSSTSYGNYYNASKQYEWIENSLYIAKNEKLWVVDAKTSSLILKLANGKKQDRSLIEFGFEMWDGKSVFVTPCVLDGKILYGQNSLMEQFDVVK